MVIVQVVTTTWTKASRGHPGSVARARVPEAVALTVTPSDPDPGEVLVDTHRAEEADGFVLQVGTVERRPLPAVVAGVRLEAVDGSVHAVRLARRTMGFPRNERDRPLFTLGAGETGRLVMNRRTSGYHGWSYEKVVVNVAVTPGADRDVFVRRDPDERVDEQADLF